MADFNHQFPPGEGNNNDDEYEMEVYDGIGGQGTFQQYVAFKGDHHSIVPQSNNSYSTASQLPLTIPTTFAGGLRPQFTSQQGYGATQGGPNGLNQTLGGFSNGTYGHQVHPQQFGYQMADRSGGQQGHVGFTQNAFSGHSQQQMAQPRFAYTVDSQTVPYGIASQQIAQPRFAYAVDSQTGPYGMASQQMPQNGVAHQPVAQYGVVNSQNASYGMAGQQMHQNGTVPQLPNQARPAKQNANISRQTATTQAAIRASSTPNQNSATGIWSVPYLNLKAQEAVWIKQKNMQEPAPMLRENGITLYQHFGRAAELPAERICRVINLRGTAGFDEEKKALIKQFEGESIAIAKPYHKHLQHQDPSQDAQKDAKKKAKKTAKQNNTANAGSAAGSDADQDVEMTDMTTDSEEEDRPDDPIDAAIWDARQITYDLDRHVAYKELGDFLGALLAAVKTASPNSKADEAKLVGVLDGLHGTSEKRKYWWIIEQMGQHRTLLLRLVSLLDRALKSKSLGGALALATLRWLSIFKSFDATAVKELKLKIRLEKYLAKVDNKNAESLLRKILGNVQASEAAAAPTAVQSTLQQHVTSATPAASTQNQHAPKKINAPSTTNSSKDPTTTSSTSPFKRPLEEASEDRSIKKVALTPGSLSNSTKPVKQPPNAVKSLGAPITTAQVGSAASTPRSVLPSAGHLPGKSRVVSKSSIKTEAVSALGAKPIMAPKGTTPKPSALQDELPKPASGKVKKFSALKAHAVSGSSKLGALLEEISKPKEPSNPVDVAKDAQVAPETPEEKAKRLRKESRRSLRVSWKDGDELTQVKYFETDASEHTGIQDKTMRGEEGKALKDAKAKAKAMDTLDEDDDGVEKPWQTPVQVNLSSIPETMRTRTYETRGGLIVVDTPDQATMRKREGTVLMEIYTDPADIPPTPKSPLLGSIDPVQNARAEGSAFPNQDPRFQEVLQRWHDSSLQGIAWASQAALHRVHAKKAAAHTAVQAGPSRVSPAQAYSSSWSDEVLRLLQSDAVKKYKSTFDGANPKTQRRYDYPDPAFQELADNIEDVFAMFKDELAMADKPPAWIKDPKRIEEWWKGYNRDNKRKAAEKAQQQAAQLAATQSQASAGTASNPQDVSTAWDQWFAAHHAYNQGRDIPREYLPAYQHWQQRQQQAQPVQPQQTDNGVQNLLAALGSSAQSAQSQPAQANNGIQNLLAALGGNAQTAQQSTVALVPNPADPAALMKFLSSQQGMNNQGSNNAGGYGQQPSSQQPLEGSQGPHGQGQQQGFGYDGTAQGQQHQYGGRNKRDSRDSRDSRNSRDSRENRDHRDDSGVPNHLRGINRNLIGTKQCTFYLQGKCVKGDKCTFRHD